LRHGVGHVKVLDIALAVVVAVAVSGGVGLAVGFAARHFGWSTGFVGPLTGGIVSSLTIVVYHIRTGRSDRDKP
jgi:predicted membrane protein